MGVAVDGDAIGLAAPGADRRLQIIHIVVEIDLLLDPIGHLRGQALAADIALEGCAHLEDVEVDGAAGDGLLKPRVVIGLGEIDPVDLCTGIGLPGLQEAAEEEIVQVLIVEPHEAELDALELALLDVHLGRRQAELADLLPIGVRGRAFAHARDLQELRPEVTLCPRAPGKRAEDAGRAQGRGGRAGSLQDIAPAGLQREKPIIVLCFHRESSRSSLFSTAWPPRNFRLSGSEM